MLSDVPQERWEDWYVGTGEDQLRELARQVWDPVGIERWTPAAELDSYLPDLADAVRRAGSPEELASYLTRIEHRNFVLDRTEEDLLPAARKILGWYQHSASAFDRGSPQGFARQAR